MSASVKLGSPLKKPKKFKNIKNYINNKHYKFKLGAAYVIREYMLRDKLLQLSQWILNTIITGALIYYIVENKNFISYGLSAMLLFYYLDIAVQIIKKPHPENIKK